MKAGFCLLLAAVTTSAATAEAELRGALERMLKEWKTARTVEGVAQHFAPAHDRDLPARVRGMLETFAGVADMPMSELSAPALSIERVVSPAPDRATVEVALTRRGPAVLHVFAAYRFDVVKVRENWRIRSVTEDKTCPAAATPVPEIVIRHWCLAADQTSPAI